MAVLVIGGILVLALVGWAVSRSMNAPDTAPAMATFEATSPTPTPSPITGTSATMPPVSTLPPVATNSAPVNENPSVQRIQASELQKQIAANAVTVIDVRDLVSYGNGHIPGALHIPLTRIEGEVQYLPKDKPVVTYCT